MKFEILNDISKADKYYITKFQYFTSQLTVEEKKKITLIIAGNKTRRHGISPNRDVNIKILQTLNYNELNEICGLSDLFLSHPFKMLARAW